MKWIMFLVLFLTAKAWAGEISLIQKDLILPKKQAAVSKAKKQPDQTQEQKPVQTQPQVQSPTDFDQMQDFMHQENERIKAIKILNLDLEREDLELKKKEIEVKLADLDKGAPARTISSGLPGTSQPMYKLAGIFLDGQNKDILMNIDGLNVQAKEGEQLQGGIMVKKIGADSVVLQHSDGKNETLTLGS